MLISPYSPWPLNTSEIPYPNIQWYFTPFDATSRFSDLLCVLEQTLRNNLALSRFIFPFVLVAGSISFRCPLTCSTLNFYCTTSFLSSSYLPLETFHFILFQFSLSFFFNFFVFISILLSPSFDFFISLNLSSNPSFLYKNLCISHSKITICISLSYSSCY